MTNNNFIYAKTKAQFLDHLEAGVISSDAIVFIEDSGEIWNHGTFFAGKPDITLDDLSTLQNVQADWNEISEHSDAYIKNKPDLSVYETKNGASQKYASIGLVTTVGELSDELEGFNETLTDVSETVEELGGTVTTISGQITEINTKVTGMGDVTGSINSINEHLSNIDDDIEGINDELEKINKRDIYVAATVNQTIANAESAAKTYADGIVEGVVNDVADFNNEIAARVKSNEDAITAIEDELDSISGGVGSVATQINNAITALDLPNTYDAKGSANTVKEYVDELDGNMRDRVLALEEAGHITNITTHLELSTDVPYIDFHCNNNNSNDYDARISCHENNIFRIHGSLTPGKSDINVAETIGLPKRRYNTIYALNGDYSGSVTAIKGFIGDLTGTASSANKVNGTLTVGSKTFDGSESVTITASDLNLSSALNYCGITTTAITDGASTNPIKINNADHTAVAGCVVFYGDKEFIWNGTTWEEFGYPTNLSGYKTKQNAVSDPTASGDSVTFIDSISQNDNGVITATKKNVKFPDYSDTYQPKGNYKTKQTPVSNTVTNGNALAFIDAISQDANGVISVTKKSVQAASSTDSGIVTTTSQTFAGDKTFSRDAKTIDFGDTTEDTTNVASDVATINIYNDVAYEAKHVTFNYTECSFLKNVTLNYRSAFTTGSNSVTEGNSGFSITLTSTIFDEIMGGMVGHYTTSSSNVNNASEWSLTKDSSEAYDEFLNSELYHMFYISNQVVPASWSNTGYTGIVLRSDLSYGASDFPESIYNEYINIGNVKNIPIFIKCKMSELANAAKSNDSLLTYLQDRIYICAKEKSSSAKKTLVPLTQYDFYSGYVDTVKPNFTVVLTGVSSYQTDVVELPTSTSTIVTYPVTGTNGIIKFGNSVLTSAYIKGATALQVSTQTATTRLIYNATNHSFRTNGTVLCSINSNGVHSTNGFFETSDERLKDFGDDISVNFDSLIKIPKKYFTWKDNNDSVHIGTSAQEIQKVYPELVNECSDGTLTVAYDKLSIVALKAIDELYIKNLELEERLCRLENLINNK